jgi:hypothetical protein
MLNEIDIEVTGLDELDRAMANFLPEFNRTAVADGVEAAAAYLAAKAKEKAPLVSKNFGSRRPGELRDAISVVMRKLRDDHPELTRAWVGPIYGTSGATHPNQDPGYWGQFVEYGSEHNPVAEPYLRPTVDGDSAAAVEIFVREASSHFNENSSGAGI